MIITGSPARLAKRAFVLGLGVTLAGSSLATAAFASSPQKVKPLSMADVTITSSNTPVNAPLFVALQTGIFRKYGLDVTWLNTAQSGALAATTALLASSAQFAIDGVATQVAAVENGAPIRVLAMDGTGGVQQLIISKAAAAAHHVPTADRTKAQVAKQIGALKGSHLNIAVSSLTSNAYYWFAGMAKHYGLTIGTSKSSGDVYMTTVGTPANEAAAYLSGKVDGLINVPPITSQPGSVLVPFYKLDPLESVVTNYLATTIGLIRQHPDTVQAVTTAYESAIQFMHSHQRQAEGILASVLSQAGTTDPGLQKEDFQLNLPTWKNPYPSRSVFDKSVALFNISLAKPFAVPYNTFVVSRFAKTAAKSLHLSIPA